MNSTADPPQNVSDMLLMLKDGMEEGMEDGKEDGEMRGETPDVTCAIYGVIVRGFIVGGICILGSIGNLMSAYTVWPTIRTHSLSLLVFSLAVFDTTFLLSALLNMAVPALDRYFSPGSAWERWVSPYLYAFYRPVGRMGHYGGTWTVIFITFHRYIAVCHPAYVKRWCSIRKARMQMIILAVVCIAFATPGFFQYKIVTRADNTGVTKVKTNAGSQKFWFDMFYETILYFTLIYVIPFPWLLAMTYKLYRSLKEAKSRREGMTHREVKEYDLTRTLVAVVVVYILTQTPNPIRRGVLAYTPPDRRGCGHTYVYYHPLSTLLMLANAAVNFLIYCAFGKRFRYVFHDRMRHLLRRERRVYPRLSNSSDVGLSSKDRPAFGLSVKTNSSSNIETKNTHQEAQESKA